MSDLVIRTISPLVTIFSIPFARFSLVPIGGRSTALTLNNGGLFVLVSSPLDAETKGKIATLGNGNVEWLLTPDYVHAGHIEEFHKAYPQALCVGPEGIDTKKPNVKWEHVFKKGVEEHKIIGAEGEIELLYIPSHKNLEIATFHKSSKTLIVADLLFNLPAIEQYSKSTHKASMPWPLNGFYNDLKPGSKFMDTMAGGVTQNGPAMVKSVRTVADWDFDRIIPCHGDVIETGGKEAWLAAFRSVLAKHEKK